MKPFRQTLMFSLPLIVIAWFVWRDPSEFRVATAGAVMQLFGVFTVVYDLWRNAELFGKGFPRAIRARLSEFLRLGVVGTAAASGTGLLGQIVGKGFGSQQQTINPNDPLPQQVATLQANITHLNAGLGVVYGEIHRAIGAFDSKVRAEIAILHSDLEGISTKLEESMIGNRYALMIGAIWLAIGIFVSAWVHQIALAAVGPWSAVVKTL